MVPRASGIPVRLFALVFVPPKIPALARELKINIVPGTFCEVHRHDPMPISEMPGGTEIRNMAYWIAAGTGELIGSYQKVNLWHPERKVLAAPEPPDGDPSRKVHKAFDTPLIRAAGDGTETKPIRAGMLICWDTIFPEAFRALAAEGAELIVVPSFWLTDPKDESFEGVETVKINPDCEKVLLSNVVVTRAFENECVVVFCNAGGVSQVAVPVVGRAPAEKIVKGSQEMTPAREGWIAGTKTEEMAIVEVDFQAVKVLKGEYKTLEDMEKRGWKYYEGPWMKRKE
jgi:Predicted amidohydrolase